MRRRILSCLAAVLLIFLARHAWPPAALADAPDNDRTVTVSKAEDEEDAVLAFLAGPDGKLTVTSQTVKDYQSFTLEKFGEKVTLLFPGKQPIILDVADLKANVMKGRTARRAYLCSLNLKNIGTSLKLYALDNGDRYPASLSQLVPKPLKALPTCPAAKADTYSKGYQSAPGAFTVVCSGGHHTDAGLEDGFPQYTSAKGAVPVVPAPGSE